MVCNVEVVWDVEGSTVMVSAGDNRGSGVIIEESPGTGTPGFVLTCAHVVRNHEVDHLGPELNIWITFICTVPPESLRQVAKKDPFLRKTRKNVFSSVNA